MRAFRKEKIGSLILEELNNILIREIEFKDALVTLTDVDVSSDLEIAKVGFSVIPSEKSDYVLKILNKFKGRLQFWLLKKINIRPMPKLMFKINYGIENAAEVEKLLLEEDNKSKI
ncbi:MAG: 30S ribosome-binding factor RbfA [Patescibacteria group bacterium]